MARISSDTAEVIIAGVDQTGVATASAKRNFTELESAAMAASRTISMAFAAVGTLTAAWSVADRAAGFMEQEAALNHLAATYGSSSQQMINSIKQMSDGTVSSLEAVDMATKGLATGLTPDQIANLTSVAKAYGDITNQTTAQTLEEIGKAAEFGNSRMLRQAGIVVDINKAWAEYAAQTGRTADQLSKAEKQQVSVNAIMAATKGTMAATASAGMSAADAMDKFRSAMSDIAIVAGKVVLTISTAAFGITQAISMTINNTMSLIATVIAATANGINDFVQKLPAPQWMKDTTAAAAESTNGIKAYFADTVAVAESNMKQSIEMVKGYWSELPQLPKSAGIPTAEEDAGSLKAAEKLKNLKEVEVLMASVKSGFDPFKEMDTMNTQIKNLSKYYDKKIELSRAAGASEIEIAKIKNQQISDIEKQNQQMRISYTTTAMSAMVGITQNLYNASGQKSKEMFELNKAFSIGQAVMSTYEGANKALAMGPWGIPIAALIVASGLANVAAIASAQPGSAGGGGAAPAPAGSGFNNTSLQSQQQQEPQSTLVVDTTNLNWHEKQLTQTIITQIFDEFQNKGKRFPSNVVIQ